MFFSRAAKAFADLVTEKVVQMASCTGHMKMGLQFPELVTCLVEFFQVRKTATNRKYCSNILVTENSIRANFLNGS